MDEGWEAQVDESGTTFYYNSWTDETSWEAPAGFQQKQEDQWPDNSNWDDIENDAYNNWDNEPSDAIGSQWEAATNEKFTEENYDEQRTAIPSLKPPPPNRHKWEISRRWRKAYLYVTHERYQKVLGQETAHFKAANYLQTLQKKKGVVPGIAAAEADLKATPPPPQRALNQVYSRLGILCFEEGEYLKAIEWLNKACEHRKHNHHLFRLCGQAYIKLYEEDNNYSHLGEARLRLFKALTLVTDTVEAMATLPHALMELANVYERFGAFEGALQVMGKVTEFFHGFGKYHEVLHRCVVIMTHLSYIPGADREALMLRCLEFLDTLFEEKDGGRHPLSQRDDVLLLYARCCIRCAHSMRDVLSPLIRINQAKGEAAYEQVFNLRKDAQEADAERHLSWRAWISSGETLLLLAREHADMGELTLAALFYDDLYDALKPNGLRRHPEGLNICLEATYNSANFQDIPTAVEWAKRGFEIREHDSRIREFLGLHSPFHASLFREEALAAEGAQRHWRKRILNPKHYQFYIDAQLGVWEKELSSNYWDPILRSKLAYFSRSKWRGLFLFEEATATRIQKWVIRSRSNRLYRAFLLETHLKKCATALNRLRMRPYDLSVRNAAIDLANHKLTPNKHRLKKLKAEFDEQNEAVMKMQRQYKRLLADRLVKNIRKQLLMAATREREAAALTIQQGMRCRKARELYETKLEEKENREGAAVTLQHFWAEKRKAWQVMKEIKSSQQGLLLAKKQRDAAIDFQRCWRGHVQYHMVKVVWVVSAIVIQAKFRAYEVRLYYYNRKQSSATRLQHFWKNQVGRKRWNALLANLLEVKRAPPQPLSSHLLARCLQKGRKQIKYLNVGDGGDYKNTEDYDEDEAGAPGGQLLPWRFTSLYQHQPDPSLSKHWVLPEYEGIGLPGSPAWTHASAQKHVIFVADHYRTSLSLPPRDVGCVHSFDTSDVLMLSCLLRNAACKLDTIALLGVDMSRQDAAMEFVSAVSDNRSLRRLVLAGCKLDFEVLTALFRGLTAHNFTLKELIIDGNPILNGGVGSIAASVLVADFFGSQYGRLEVLSLCRMGLKDEDIVAIAKSLAMSVSNPPPHHQDSNMSKGGPKGWSLSLGGSLGTGHLGVALENERSTGGLRRLILGENDISDDGVSELIEGLRIKDNVSKKWHDDGRRCPPGLWELELGGNQITDVSVEALLKYIISTTPATQKQLHSNDVQWFQGLAEMAGHPNDPSVKSSYSSLSVDDSSTQSGLLLRDGSRLQLPSTTPSKADSANIKTCVNDCDDFVLGLKPPPSSCTLVKLGLSNNLIQDRIINLIKLLPQRCPWLYFTLEGNLFRPQENDTAVHAGSKGRRLYELTLSKRIEKELHHGQPTDQKLNNMATGPTISSNIWDEGARDEQDVPLLKINQKKIKAPRIRSDDNKIDVLYLSRLMQGFTPHKPLGEDIPSIDLNKGEFRFLESACSESEIIENRRKDKSNSWQPLPLPSPGKFTSECMGATAAKLELMTSSHGASSSLSDTEYMNSLSLISGDPYHQLSRSSEKRRKQGKRVGKRRNRRSEEFEGETVVAQSSQTFLSTSLDTGVMELRHGVTGALASSSLRTKSSKKPISSSSPTIKRSTSLRGTSRTSMFTVGSGSLEEEAPLRSTKHIGAL